MRLDRYNHLYDLKNLMSIHFIILICKATVVKLKQSLKKTRIMYIFPFLSSFIISIKWLFFRNRKYIWKFSAFIRKSITKIKTKNFQIYFKIQFTEFWRLKINSLTMNKTMYQTQNICHLKKFESNSHLFELSCQGMLHLHLVNKCNQKS